MCCMVGLWQISGGLPPLSLLLAPLVLLCTSWLSASLDLASSSQPDASWCLHDRVNFQHDCTGWLYEADPFCANPPHFDQRLSGGLLGIIRRPLWFPYCLHSPNSMVQKNACRVYHSELYRAWRMKVVRGADSFKYQCGVKNVIRPKKWNSCHPLWYTVTYCL